MPREIERKFLVSGNGWRKHADRGKAIRQAYLVVTDTLTLRVRTIDRTKAFLTIKTAGASTERSEFEYPILASHARSLMKLRIGRLIVKRRHLVKVGRTRFEVDVFARDHRGLVIAEVELPSRRSRLDRPNWLGKEVTGMKRYYNDRLARG